MLSIFSTFLVGGIIAIAVQFSNHVVLPPELVWVILGATFVVLFPLLWRLLSVAMRYQEKSGGPSGWGG